MDSSEQHSVLSVCQWGDFFLHRGQLWFCAKISTFYTCFLFVEYKYSIFTADDTQFYVYMIYLKDTNDLDDLSFCSLIFIQS